MLSLRDFFLSVLTSSCFSAGSGRGSAKEIVLSMKFLLYFKLEFNPPLTTVCLIYADTEIVFEKMQIKYYIIIIITTIIDIFIRFVLNDGLDISNAGQSSISITTYTCTFQDEHACMQRSLSKQQDYTDTSH